MDNTFYGSPEYGFRWRVINRTGHLETRERFFKTATAMERFATKASEKPNFIETVAYSYPSAPVAPTVNTL